MSERLADTCTACNGDGFTVFWLPGDGTTAMESVAVECEACGGAGSVKSDPAPTGTETSAASLPVWPETDG